MDFFDPETYVQIKRRKRASPMEENPGRVRKATDYVSGDGDLENREMLGTLERKDNLAENEVGLFSAPHILEARNAEMMESASDIYGREEMKAATEDPSKICELTSSIASEADPIPVSEVQDAGGNCISEIQEALGNDGGHLVTSLASDSENDLENVRSSSFARAKGTIEKCSELINAEALNACERKRKLFNRRYSRGELENLRYVDVEEQQKRWDYIYHELGVVVARELDQTVAAKHQKQAHKNNNHRQHKGKKKDASLNSGEVCFQNMGTSSDGVKSVELTCGVFIGGAKSPTFVEEVCSEDNNSDDDYDSIQRPAFFVEGEPDFESGPPEDGLEYLRRVRWEAAQIPKVKVVKVDENKLNREQTAYMPNIPEIAKCPVHLLPSERWEDAFLADFSNLRQVLAQLENSSDKCSGKLLPFLSSDAGRIHEDQQMPTDIPTVSAIMAMDSVSRASMLRARIDSLETATVLSRVDCLSLFALCAAVDVPFNAEMGASLRCLLRKCAGLRAQKLETDDEVVMLNILVTIAGRFFGQSDRYS